MAIIPLVTSPEFCSDDFVSPESGAKVNTTDYGKLGFSNTSEKTMIVPAHTAYIVKQAAQDHAMTEAGIVKGKGRRTWDNAACVQSGQGGMISSAEHDMSILPLPLRFAAHANRKGSNCSKIWGDIEKFNESMGLTRRGHLEDFLKGFSKQLDEFVAEFEIVENQVGAIILVNDKIVGVERTPNFQYWRDVWPHLVRECYGGFTLQVQKKLGSDKELKPLSTRIPLPDSIASLEDLEVQLQAVIAQEDQKVKDIVNAVVTEDMELKTEDSVTDLSVDTLENSVFVGQLIRRGEAVVYGSVILSETERDKMTWKRAQSFSM